MSFEAKKLNLLNWIMSINDEKTIDRITHFVSKFFNIKSKAVETEGVDLTPFVMTIEKDFDLDKIAKAQNYKSTSDEEMEAIIANIQIEEPLEDLLKMLD
jgi:hypothetical protein